MRSMVGSPVSRPTSRPVVSTASAARRNASGSCSRHHSSVGAAWSASSPAGTPSICASCTRCAAVRSSCAASRAGSSGCSCSSTSTGRQPAPATVTTAVRTSGACSRTWATACRSCWYQPRGSSVGEPSVRPRATMRPSAATRAARAPVRPTSMPSATPLIRRRTRRAPAGARSRQGRGSPRWWAWPAPARPAPAPGSGPPRSPRSRRPRCAPARGCG